jgi:23S rRNA pseudouridine1911/1915/1917 synthase
MILIKYEIVESERIDIFLSKNQDISRNKIINLIKDHKVSLNGIVVDKASLKLKCNDIIAIDLADLYINNEIMPENIPLDIVFENKNIIIVNKPKGMLTHPTSKIKTGTLVNALIAYSKDLSFIYGSERAGIVHRLDRDTSGLLIVTKNDFAHNYMTKLFKDRKIEKHYYALVHGNIKEDNAKIYYPLIKDSNTGLIKVSQKGRFASTEITVKERIGEYTFLDVSIQTGRTHQIRVHLSYIGHPIVGDILYGRKESSEVLNLLHAYKLKFILPEEDIARTFIIPLPEDFNSFIQSIKNP